MTEFLLQELAAAAIRHRYRSTSWWQLIIVIAIGYGIRWLIVNAGSKARTQNPVRTFLRTGLGDSKKNFWGAEHQQNSVNGFDPNSAGQGGGKYFNSKLFVRSIIISILAAIFVALAGYAVAYAGSNTSKVHYSNVNYETEILNNGDIKVRQHLDTRLDEQNNGQSWHQIYWKYDIDPNKYSSIKDISVKRSDTAEDYAYAPFKSPAGMSDQMWNQEYSKQWYAYDITAETDFTLGSKSEENRKIEIGWNIPSVKSGNMSFEIELTFENILTVHSDVAYFKWEPIGSDNTIPIENLSADVKFPQEPEGIQTWAWLHFGGKSTVSRTSESDLHFTAQSIGPHVYIDLVAMCDSSAIPNSLKVFSEPAKDKVIAEETAEEKTWYEFQEKQARKNLLCLIAGATAAVLLAIWLMIGAFRTYRLGHYLGTEIYWREPLDISPAATAEIAMYMGLGNRSSKISRIISSSILSLATKGYLSIYPGPAHMYHRDGNQYKKTAQMFIDNPSMAGVKKSTSTIAINHKVLTDQSLDLFPSLSYSETCVLTLLRALSVRTGFEAFDLNMMREKCKNWTSGSVYMKNIERAAASEFKAACPTKSAAGWTLMPSALQAVAAIFCFGQILSSPYPLIHAIIVMLAVFTAVFSICYSSKRVLTPAGNLSAGRVVGLYNYLNDFSNFKDRDSRDLVLWDRYLVYAAAMGISDKAIKEFAKAYPSLAETDNSGMYDTVLYWYVFGSPRGYYDGHSGSYGTNANFGTQSNMFSQGFAPNFDFAAGFIDIGSQLEVSFSNLNADIAKAHFSEVADSASKYTSNGSFGGGFGGFGGSSGGFGSGASGAR